MEKHDIARLDGQINDLSAQLTSLADNTDLEELRRLFHQPWWTTPAEFMLVSGVVYAMQEHAKFLTNLKQVLIDGSRAVGSESELNPQPLPPKQSDLR
jgi:hypothetical protein